MPSRPEAVGVQVHHLPPSAVAMPSSAARAATRSKPTKAEHDVGGVVVAHHEREVEVVSQGEPGCVAKTATTPAQTTACHG